MGGIWFGLIGNKRKKINAFFFILRKKNFSNPLHSLWTKKKKSVSHLSLILRSLHLLQWQGWSHAVGAWWEHSQRKALCCQGHRNCSSWAGVGEPENYPDWPENWQPAWKASMISKCPEFTGQPRKQPDLTTLGHPGGLFW